MSFLSTLTPADAMVAGLLCVAVYTDLRSRKVPNVLTFGTMAAALVVHPVVACSRAGLEGLFPAVLVVLAGIGVAFVPGFIMWNLGGAMKAGDAKLLMAMGAILGPFDVLRVFLTTLLVEIPIGIVQLVRAGKLRSFFSVIKAGVTRRDDGPKPLVAPFAGVIAIGYLVSRIFPQLFGFWS